jgi:photosystem II stability/assembly factor-like uncharacterized protein
MKQILILSTMLTILITNVYGQWQILSGGNFNSIDYVDENVMYLYSESTRWGSWGIIGDIWKTEDSGETWTEIRLEEWSIYYGLDFYNDSVGMIQARKSGGDSTCILKTMNGGESWQLSYLFPDSLQACKTNISLITENIAFIKIHRDYFENFIIRTINGGVTWSVIKPIPQAGDITYLHFFDENNGFIIQDDIWNPPSVLITVDAGESWQKYTLNGLSDIGDVEVVNDTTIYFNATTDIPDEKIFCKTNDIFNSYSTIFQTSLGGINSFYAKDEHTIFALRSDNDTTNVIKSIDGGTTWHHKQRIHTGFDSEYGDIFLSDSNIGFILGDGLLHKSTDNGENWKLFKIGYPFKNTFFIDQNKGFLLGSYPVWRAPGVLFFTNDGGRTWLHNFNPINSASIVFLNEYEGFLLENRWDSGSASRAAIYKTTDQGNTWIECYTNSPGSSYSLRGEELSVLNDSTILVIGGRSRGDPLSGSIIISSSDKGENWNLAWDYLSGQSYPFGLNSINVINGNAWAVGDNGLIVKSIAIDSFQVNDSLTTLPLKDVFFCDEYHGWISGGYFENVTDFQSTLFKTEDGGHIWQEITLDQNFINDMYFTDSLHGWAVGHDTITTTHWLGQGVILETTDGGCNWTPVLEDLSGPLNDLHFNSGVGWAVGEDGLILRTDNWTTWIDQSTRKTYPSKYKLIQNYPNPFNPVTTIKYHIPNSEQVKLSIYNVLGQMVARLVNKKQSAGTYKVEWNASGFASGIYFYRIETEMYTNTRKMILLR